MNDDFPGLRIIDFDYKRYVVCSFVQRNESLFDCTIHTKHSITSPSYLRIQLVAVIDYNSLRLLYAQYY